MPFFMPYPPMPDPAPMSGPPHATSLPQVISKGCREGLFKVEQTVFLGRAALARTFPPLPQPLTLGRGGCPPPYSTHSLLLPPTMSSGPSPDSGCTLGLWVGS